MLGQILPGLPRHVPWPTPPTLIALGVATACPFTMSTVPQSRCSSSEMPISTSEERAARKRPGRDPRSTTRTPCGANSPWKPPQMRGCAKCYPASSQDILLQGHGLIVGFYSQSKLTQQELTDLQKATHFDKKELQQWYKGTLDRHSCWNRLRKRV